MGFIIAVVGVLVAVFTRGGKANASADPQLPDGLVATVRGGKGLRRYGKRNGGERTEAAVVAHLRSAGEISIEVAPRDGTVLIQGAVFVLR